jgi:hypothetical protein
VESIVCQTAGEGKRNSASAGNEALGKPGDLPGVQATAGMILAAFSICVHG